MFFIILSLPLIAVTLLKLFTKINFTKLLKILSIVYCIMCFLSILLPDGFIVSPDSEDEIYHDIFHAILRIGNAVNFVVLPLCIFYNKREIKNIAIYFCLPFTILSIIFYKDFMTYFTSLNGRGLNDIDGISQTVHDFLLNYNFRLSFLAIQWSIALIVPLSLIILEKHHLDIKNKKELLYSFLLLILFLFMFMPIYVPQILFGFTNLKFCAFSICHLLWLLLIALIYFSFYYVSRQMNDENRYITCLILALSSFIQYNSMFALTINLERLPVQLCNIGSYLLLYSILTKNKVVFNFNFIANTVGAFIAMMIPDATNKGIFCVWNMHFIYEHTALFITPILAIALGVFPGINKKTLHDFLVGIGIYFTFVLISGSIINIIAAQKNNDELNVYYFFIFDAEKMHKLLPQLDFLVKIKFTIMKHTFYPCLMLFAFSGFTFLCLVFYYSTSYILKTNKQKKQKLVTIRNS